MGFIKNLFWGRFRGELVFPFPQEPAEERTRCDALLEKLDHYLKNEHPTIEIDQQEYIPDAAIHRLFDIGVMGMIIPQEYGGGGFGVTSYNRVLERIGQTCGSTAVMVGAHQSIGCGAINLFGTDEQKNYWLPRMAQHAERASASPSRTWAAMPEARRRGAPNPNAASTTSSMERRSGRRPEALSGMFTTMCKHDVTDPKTSKTKTKVTAAHLHAGHGGHRHLQPEPFQVRHSRHFGRHGCGSPTSRCRRPICSTRRAGIERGPHLPQLGPLHAVGGHGQGWTIGLPAGSKWAETRYQFNRPIGEFELVRDYLATMAAYNYAMDAMLYMTTGIVDRDDEDIMLETAICKVFCSEMGFRCTNMAMQVMGGEGYMTENELERLWRDSRINTIVEGANEVMRAFVFAYGSKQLGEHMLAIRRTMEASADRPQAGRPTLPGHPPAAPPGQRAGRVPPRTCALETLTREFSHQVKRMFKVLDSGILTNQMIQRRLSSMAIWIHAMTCSLSRLDQSIKSGIDARQLEHDRAIVDHICAIVGMPFGSRCAGWTPIRMPPCGSPPMRSGRRWDHCPIRITCIPEKTPDESALGQGRVPDQMFIKQFGSGSIAEQLERDVAQMQKDLA